MRRNWIFLLIGVLAVAGLAIGIAVGFQKSRDAFAPVPDAATPALARVVFATDWKAQAEHGGFYQAKALGLYEARGLDVEIRMGGPSINIPQLLGAGEIEFGMGSNQFIAMNLAEAGVPAKAVMAAFQKDPQVLIAHPRDDISSIADMAGKPIMISDATVGSFWIWLKAKFGFTDDQIRKYTFNLAPFLSDEEAIQQGYVTSEPYTIATEGGVEPEVYLLADAGYPGYASFVLARNDLITSEPELVRAFVEASIEGWHGYLEGDPAPGNALILADNPEMTPEIIAQAIEQMKARHIVVPEGGSAADIGQMTDARWESFFTTMSAQGLYPADFDYRAAYTLQFLPRAE